MTAQWSSSSTCQELCCCKGRVPPRRSRINAPLSPKHPYLGSTALLSRVLQSPTSRLPAIRDSAPAQSELPNNVQGCAYHQRRVFPGRGPSITKTLLLRDCHRRGQRRIPACNTAPRLRNRLPQTLKSGCPPAVERIPPRELCWTPSTCRESAVPRVKYTTGGTLTTRHASSQVRAWPRPARWSCAAGSPCRPGWPRVGPAVTGAGPGIG